MVIENMNFVIRKNDLYLKVFQFVTRNRAFNTMNLNRGKIFVRYGKDEDLMRITFCYGDENIIKSREFNFIRNKSEKLESAVARIRAKIIAAALPKLRKKQKKVASSQEGVPVDDIESPALNICITRSGQNVSGEVPNSEAWTNDTKLQIGESEYDVVVNGPEVSVLGLPRTILGGYFVYPKICLEFSCKEDSTFTWYRSVDSSEKSTVDEKLLVKDQSGQAWIKVCGQFFYLTSSEDLQHRLKLVCVPKYGSRCGKAEEVISPNLVVSGPERCPFEDRQEHTKSLAPAGSIRCISYNILADLYADSDTARNVLFAHCPPEFLDYEYRKQLYLKEIAGYNGDIICLQEVDRKVFQNDLSPILDIFGLTGVYNEKGGQVVEGLACFFRSSKFRFVHSEAILLNEAVSSQEIFGDLWSKICENEKLKERLLNRTTALQVVLLECVDVPNKQILIGNTHLYFHPESDNIRLLQAAICVRYLEHLMSSYEKENPSVTKGVMLCGDFNSCPEFGVLQLMVEGFVPEDCRDWQSNSEEAVPGLLLRHNFSLGSGCGTPTYTNFTQGFAGCLDYIFYDKNHFLVSEVVPLPTHEQVTKHVALPNKEFPSDHIALVCTLSWL